MRFDSSSTIDETIQPLKLLQPRRKLQGISAVLLPFTDVEQVDWDGYRAHLARTIEAGLTPAVNMDTGYINLLDMKIRHQVLAITRELCAGRGFIAGAFVDDFPGDPLGLSAYGRTIEEIQNFGGIPMVFQSYGLNSLGREELLKAYEAIGQLGPFLAFELDPAFAPFGMIYDLDTYADLLQIPACQGAKHASLHRDPLWQRLILRNELRPDFAIFCGNDLAIDMVMYGCDYLLGLSTFAPDLFAKRDQLWEQGDASFYELNDLLQYLGYLSFRPPVSGYKHNAAQFLKIRGWLHHDAPHPRGIYRPASDVSLLTDIWHRLQPWL